MKPCEISRKAAVDKIHEPRGLSPRPARRGGQPRGSWAVWLIAILLTLSTSGPLQRAAAQDDDAQTRDLLRVREKPEDHPWLRINAGGHTAGVRALAFTPDSKRLCSAGLDKNVQVWNLSAVFRDLRRVYLRERTIRWQVARGLRGSIYTIAVAPTDGLLALGGYGAMGMLGEILLVNPQTGELVAVLDSHRQTVCSLAFSPDGKTLASMDVAGQTVLWRRDGWKPTVLYRPDAETYGPEKAARIQKEPKVRPIAFLGPRQVVLPLLVSRADAATLRWKLARISIDDPKGYQLLPTEHAGMVTALAATADGRRLASADLAGKLNVWDLQAGDSPVQLPTQRPAASLSFTPNGSRLIAGTLVGRGPAAGANSPGKSELQVWDVAGRTLLRRRELPDHVQACAVSPDGSKLAYAGGPRYEVFVEPIDQPEAVVSLVGTSTRVLKVAFAQEKPLYRVAIGTTVRQQGFNDYAELEETFDPALLELDRAGKPNPGQWLTSEWLRGNWRATPDGHRLKLSRGGRPAGVVELDPKFDGVPRSYCWIPDRTGRPFAIAVGTDVQNSIYVCKLTEQGPCPVLRHFRGHHDYVTSLCVSRDLRYLVSGSADGTVRFWSLAGYQQGAEPLGRWGASLEVRGGELVFSDLREAGPLFRRGVRKGDVLTEIRWHDGRQVQTENAPAEILRQLRSLPWDAQVVFETTRRGAKRAAFQRLPAWPPLATLFVASDGEWAFWTPEGYYDASINGHTLFGWQVNRGLEKLPDFYRADQFRKRLERPDVLGKLLAAGSLDSALRAAAVVPPVQTDRVLPEQIVVTPRVDILTPRSGDVIGQGSTRVTARIRMPTKGKLVGAKVFANGVSARKRELVDDRKGDEGRELTYAWDVDLPRDERSLIQLLVSTDAPTGAHGQVVVERGEVGPIPPDRPPKLYLLAVGINQYADEEVPRLSYSVADAEAVAEQFRAGTAGLYAVEEAAVLKNQEVTPEAWEKELKSLSEKLRDLTGPDDLLVLFLAGHGIVDSETGQYYFLGHDFTLEELEAEDYDHCISWDDFQALSAIPCRKLALLDTCHSGALQPLRSYHLKEAVRALQDDVVLTVTASAGNEKAAETPEWKHGIFTKVLLDALAGRADASGDKVVSLDEVIQYVTGRVQELTDQRQNPTAGPRDVLPYTTLPLTQTGRPGD